MGNIVDNPKETGHKAAKTFEELHIYQEARILTNSIYAETRKRPFSGDWGLCDQIRRACISIMSNIAEGYERGSTTEFIQFLYIAKGSCGEVRAQLCIARDQGYLKAEEYDRLKRLASKIGGMTSNFINHLQGTRYKGEKYARPKRMIANG